jgi:two-component system cell cycle response regulator DivK
MMIGRGVMAKNILIVDDNEHLTEIMGTILKLSGYEISHAATGAEAIEKAISIKPDLILMDLELPDMSGVDAARVIKNSTTLHVPIIAWSAFVAADAREKALSAGMVDYLEKPVSISLLKAKVNLYLPPR